MTRITPIITATTDQTPLPLLARQQTEQMEDEPRLLHPFLEKIPKNLRFAAVGVLGNLIFITGFEIFKHESVLGSSFDVSTIYAIFYTLYMPISHALQASIVFGWPAVYLPSLLSVMPIGVSSMLIGESIYWMLPAYVQ